MPFTGRLRILNNKDHKARAEFLQEYGAGMGIAGTNLAELNAWIGTEVPERNEQTSVAIPLLAYARAMVLVLRAHAGTGLAARDEVAYCWVEVLRIYTQSEHDPFVMQEIYDELIACAVPVAGDLDGCKAAKGSEISLSHPTLTACE
ncbi:hypothetical protein [Reyranella sp. CPCC 100927]|uniref:hypothetical protein n=1 Tax=Reyranella sp. CPCC 100927 TaxID=2599616 RepID=UPI0011B52BBD|nr:hypothetical protein [Reyranella sp. CPCC 100927]TWT02016.1 hypothetical protein FQU96_31035 [Reyranella sp. CPCC 100927]